jgi:hypothetical protein
VAENRRGKIIKLRKKELVFIENIDCIPSKNPFLLK